jgi:hypothetical protein
MKPRGARAVPREFLRKFENALQKYSDSAARPELQFVINRNSPLTAIRHYPFAIDRSPLTVRH